MAGLGGVGGAVSKHNLTLKKTQVTSHTGLETGVLQRASACRPFSRGLGDGGEMWSSLPPSSVLAPFLSKLSLSAAGCVPGSVLGTRGPGEEEP